jgi:hypothetical protein
MAEDETVTVSVIVEVVTSVEVETLIGSLLIGTIAGEDALVKR